MPWRRSQRSAVVCAATGLDGRHHDHAGIGVEADQGSPITDAQTPLARSALETAHITRRQTLDRCEDALPFVAWELAQGLRGCGCDHRLPGGQLRRQRQAPRATRLRRPPRPAGMSPSPPRKPPDHPRCRARRQREQPQGPPAPGPWHGSAGPRRGPRSRRATRPQGGADRLASWPKRSTRTTRRRADLVLAASAPAASRAKGSGSKLVARRNPLRIGYGFSKPNPPPRSQSLIRKRSQVRVLDRPSQITWSKGLLRPCPPPRAGGDEPLSEQHECGHLAVS